MITPEETMIVGMKVLRRLRPTLEAIKAGQIPPLHNSEGEGQAGPPAVTPTLQELLEQWGGLEANSVILGLCEDGLPLVFDLGNPAPGSLLIAGDPGSGKTRLLHAILASAALINPPRQVVYSLLAARPAVFQDLLQADHCYDALPFDAARLPALFQNLLTTIENRLIGNQRGPSFILAIDDLASCLQYIDYETSNKLIAIVTSGPQVRVWTIATLPSARVGQVDAQLLSAFGTQVIEKIALPELAAALSGSEHSNAADLAAGQQFSILFGDDWIRAWICDPE